jgi:ArsR family transcriptional regulator, arsenate/arsenite/antimonite-responsive transcriptional repressor
MRRFAYSIKLFRKGLKLNKEASFLKALSNEIRLSLVILLANNGETCVCQLAGALDEPEYKISRHLAILRMQGIVEARPQGAWMYYRLAHSDSVIGRHLLEWFRDDMNDHPDIQPKLEQLKTLNCGKGKTVNDCK